MRLPRPRLTIRWMMGAVLILACHFALLRSPLGPSIALFTGTILGASIQRSTGGRGTLGGVIGGVVGSWAFFAVWARQNQGPRLDPPNDLPFYELLAIPGAAFGAILGIGLWVIAELDARSAAEVQEALRSKPEPIRAK